MRGAVEGRRQKQLRFGLNEITIYVFLAHSQTGSVNEVDTY